MVEILDTIEEKLDKLETLVLALGKENKELILTLDKENKELKKAIKSIYEHQARKRK